MATSGGTFRMKTTHKLLQPNSVSTKGSEKKSTINLMHLLDDNKTNVSFLESQYSSSISAEKPKSGSGFCLRVVPAAMADHM